MKGDPPKRKRRTRKTKGKDGTGSSAPPAGEIKADGKRAGSIAKWTILATALCLAVAACAFLFGYPLVHGPGNGRDVELSVPGDESPDALADRLAAAGLIAHPRLFAVYLRLTGDAKSAAHGSKRAPAGSYYDTTVLDKPLSRRRP